MKVFVSLKFGSFQNMDLLDTPNPYPPTQCLKFVVIAFSNEVTETFFFFFLAWSQFLIIYTFFWIKESEKNQKKLEMRRAAKCVHNKFSLILKDWGCWLAKA